jgi:hypothetical protein
LVSRKDNNALFINKIWIARDKCNGWAAAGCHHFHGGGFNQNCAVYNVNILPLLCVDDDLVARDKPI